MFSVGREFRTSAVCSVPPQACEDVGAGQQWPLGRAVAVWKIHCSRKTQSSPKVWSWDGCLGQLALWQCFMETWGCQHHTAEGHWVFKLLCQNYKSGALYSKVNDVSCAQNHLCLCFPVWKKVKKKRHYCFTICRCAIYLVFPGSIHFFLLDIFCPSSEIFCIKRSGQMIIADV